MINIFLKMSPNVIAKDDACNIDPVFVVAINDGLEKLGEGSSSSVASSHKQEGAGGWKKNQYLASLAG